MNHTEAISKIFIWKFSIKREERRSLSLYSIYKGYFWFDSFHWSLTAHFLYVHTKKARFSILNYRYPLSGSATRITNSIATRKANCIGLAFEFHWHRWTIGRPRAICAWLTNGSFSKVCGNIIPLRIRNPPYAFPLVWLSGLLSSSGRRTSVCLRFGCLDFVFSAFCWAGQSIGGYICKNHNRRAQKTSPLRLIRRRRFRIMGIVQAGEPILILPLPSPMFAETKGNRSGLALKASSSSPVDLFCHLASFDFLLCK